MSSQEAGTAVLVDKTMLVPALHSGQRLVSLDVFRGFTLLGMVLVNSHPGEIYPPLAHAGWNGWTFTDLIFPFFRLHRRCGDSLLVCQATGARYQPSEALLADSAPVRAVICGGSFPERVPAL